MFELSRGFLFDAAHSLDRKLETERSKRIHGHSYKAEVTVRGPLDAMGMVADLATLDGVLARVRDGLDHRLLDEVEDLGPPTLENLARWIWAAVAPTCPTLHRVTVRRDSDRSACSLELTRSRP